ncbi:uncharacterized protein LOC121261404 [Juglans microcarpa x Juglans regia]|uniref:uncharacterized protein LOC121261404 n=1 Tax=Juglans microcarpa x Juglans regia TaxID=2249226 RepID=UPI001B7F2D08|nr:uncharacterized protein LOC121261404 [Juglans microcarpa x Juglans regia]
MSRCFPYPPPGYVKNGEPWIDWTKLQREREKVKTDIKKEKKREEKKKRRKAHRGKEKPIVIGDDKKRKLNYQEYVQLEKTRAEPCGEYFQKQIEAEAEQFEKSDLTEEQERPICSPNVCSDSSQRSNKRKRDSSPTSGFRSHGTIVRIQLPSRKDQHDEKSCSTSGRVEFHAQQKNGSVNVPNQESLGSSNGRENILAEELTAERKKELPCPAPERIETSYKSETERTEYLYKALIENWVPPRTQDRENLFSDEEWLFKRKKQEDRRPSQKFEAGNDVISCSCKLWPQGHYLSEVDMYALPYTVPF